MTKNLHSQQIDGLLDVRATDVETHTADIVITILLDDDGTTYGVDAWRANASGTRDYWKSLAVNAGRHYVDTLILKII